MHEYDKMLKWVKEGSGNRTISIEIGRSGDDTYLRKWAYDFDLKVGQHFDSIDEVDLEKVKETEEQLEYMRLKQKFEKGDN
jgi:hypothetical protein